MADTKTLLANCLYFTANALERVITRMAGEEFRATGLSPSHAFLLMLACEEPGIAQKELGQALHLAPSTVTRLVDALAARKLVTRASEGKSARITPTEQGLALQPDIAAAWKRLQGRYCTVLGQEAGDDLARAIGSASSRLEDRC